MPIDVICPKCQSKLRAPDEVVGKYVRCKKCQEKFKVTNPGAPVDSVGDTQMLSVVEMPTAGPKPVPANPAPAEVVMLDDSAFEDPIPAPVKAPVLLKPAAPAAPAAPAPLPLPAPTDPFAFTAPTDDEEKPKKKKKRDDEDDEDDDDRPKKKKKVVEEVEGDDEDEEEKPKKKKKRDDDEDEDDDRPKKKKKEKPLIGGEPTFAMPGAAEDPVPTFVPPPAHVGQFAFEEPAPAKKGKARDDDDEGEDDRPKKKKKRSDDEEADDDRPKGKGKKAPAKSKKLLYILGGVAAVLFLGCGGAAAGVYFFVIKATDSISKATFTVGSTPTSKTDTKPPTSRKTNPTGVGTGTETPVPAGPPVTPFVLPTGLQNGTVVAPGTSIPLPFPADFVKQIQRFDDPEFGAMLFAIYQSNPGFNGVGSEDTVVRFDIGKKAVAGQFVIPADGIPGPRIIDISDSGYRVAVEAPKGRLTVYNFADKTADVPIDVFAGLPQREGIVAIAFADPEGRRVAVVDKLGAVDVWDVKERQRTVTGKPDPSKANTVAERRKPRAGKGYLASKDAIRGVLWNTGELDPPIKLPAKTGVPTLLSVRDGHDHFAIVHLPEGGTEREVLVVDKAGVPVWRIPLPAATGAPRTLRWIQGGAVLAVGFDPANGVLLLDFASKTPAVYLKPAQDKTALNDAGDVSVLPDPKMPGKAALVQAAIPANSLAAMVETAKNNKTPERVYAKPEGLNQ